MISSIAYILFGALAIAGLMGIIIIIRNSIKIATTYKFFRKKLKAQNRVKITKINSVKLPAAIQKASLVKM